MNNENIYECEPEDIHNKMDDEDYAYAYAYCKCPVDLSKGLKIPKYYLGDKSEGYINFRCKKCNLVGKVFVRK